MSPQAKTLFFPFPLCQNTIPFHTWLHLVTTWLHLVTTWQHMITTWQQLVTPGNSWPPLTDNMRAYTTSSLVVPPIKFEFPAIFFSQNLATELVPEIKFLDIGPPPKVLLRSDLPHETSLRWDWWRIANSCKSLISSPKIVKKTKNFKLSRSCSH